MLNEQLLLWIVGASMALNAVFLRRLLAKLDAVHDEIRGTVTHLGLRERVARVESAIGYTRFERGDDAPPDDERRRGPGDRRKRGE